MKRIAILTAAALAAAALSACAGGMPRLGDDGIQVRPADYAEEAVERFNTFRLDGWTPASRDSLVVWNGRNEAYLLKVWDTCRDLQFAEAISVTSTGRSISKFEQVRVGADLCPIREIRRIDVAQYRVDRAAAVAALRGEGTEPPRRQALPR